MYPKTLEKELRKSFSKTGIALMVYYGIMNAAVLVVLIVDIIIRIILLLQSSMTSAILTQTIMETTEEAILSNGWGYILANVIGFVALLLWKKKDFCFREIWVSDKGMKPGSFFALLAMLISAQAVFQIGVGILEWIFNQMGLSVLDSLDGVTMLSGSFSMFLYAGIIAPIGEEILFRGLILRSLQPYGKKFAILTSAFLFGIFHGNFLQTPYALLVGLLLGYVTVEYSIGWAMVLHMFNNLVLADMISRMSSYFPPFVEELAMLLIIWGSAVAAVIILVVKRKDVMQYFKGPKIHPLCMKCFITSPGILIFTGLMAASILFGLLMSLA